MAKVEELGLNDNTFIFFLADNGGVPFFPPNSPEKEGKKGMGYNLPLQRGKWDLFEGGLRVPFMVKGPGIKPNTFCDTPVITYDLLPTIADLVKLKGKLPEDLDGQSIKPLLTGAAKIGNRSLFFHSPYISATGIGRPTSAIREGKFKLIKYLDNGQVQLFDLNLDIGENKDLSKQNPVNVKLLETKLVGYLQSVHAITFEELKKVINISAKSD
jgi:arylsulfatase A-like enzyme